MKSTGWLPWRPRHNRSAASRLGFVAACLAAGFVAAPRVHAQAEHVSPTPAPAAFAQRFAAALTFEKFVASDTARRDEWHRNHLAAAAAVQAFATSYGAIPGRWRLLIVAEPSCGDAVNSVPYLARLAEARPTIEMRLLRKADAPDLLAAHQLDGQSVTPLVLVLDSAWTLRGTWIERPAPLRQLIKSKQGRTCADALDVEVAAWRRKDGGRSVLAEVVQLMSPGAPQAAHTHHSSDTKR